MSIIRALLAAGLALGLSTQPTAAEPTCSSILDVSIADPESPSPVELRQVAAAARTAIAAQHEKHADAFPAQRDGVVGMMKGGGLKTVGYSKHGHANEPKTFPDCLDACYDDCKCLGFQWSEKLARCGLKADGNIPVSVDNRYQKTFRSFKRLEVTDCTPATTTLTVIFPNLDFESTDLDKLKDDIDFVLDELGMGARTMTFEAGSVIAIIVYSTTDKVLVDALTEEAVRGAMLDKVAITTTSTTTAEPTTLGYCSHHTNSTATFEFKTNGQGPYVWDPVKGYFVHYTDPQVPYGILNTFDTSAVTTMKQLFIGESDFNQNLNCWATGAVTDMSYTFWDAAAFNQNINGWSTGNVTNMGAIFAKAVAFNQNVNNWATSAVTTMRKMFADAAAFNTTINKWNTGAVTSMESMFQNAAAFDQNVNNWATSAVTAMQSVFAGALAFDQNLNNWDTGAVTSMHSMFKGTLAFNQNIGGWNTGAVTTMVSMFEDAAAFSQNLSNWNTSAVEITTTTTTTTHGATDD